MSQPGNVFPISNKGMNSVTLTVVRAVSLTLILSVVAMVVLGFFGKPIPDKLGDIAQSALVGVSALLARTSNQPEPVTVVNPPSNPVATDEVPPRKKVA